jgi:hypothetical protein
MGTGRPRPVSVGVRGEGAPAPWNSVFFFFISVGEIFGLTKLPRLHSRLRVSVRTRQLIHQAVVLAETPGSDDAKTD